VTSIKPSSSSQAQSAASAAGPEPAQAISQNSAQASQPAGPLQLSPDDLHTLIDAVAKLVVRMQQPQVMGQAVGGKELIVDVSSGEQKREIKIPFPPHLLHVSETDPRIISMVMSAINADAYRAGDFRAYADPIISGVANNSGVQAMIRYTT
jgi:hypothetical protein